MTYMRAVPYNTKTCLLWMRSDDRIRRSTTNRIPRTMLAYPFHTFETTDTINHSVVSCFIAVGSNMGDRYDNIVRGMQFLEKSNPKKDLRIMQTSFLYETAPMYVTHQQPFLNGMIHVQTTLSPTELLKRLKSAEVHVGRDIENPIRNGPRPLDLDIIYYGIQPTTCDQHHHVESCQSRTRGGVILETMSLKIPHEKIQERDFVLFPLQDLNPNLIHPISNLTSSEMLSNLFNRKTTSSFPPSPIRILPLPRGRFLNLQQPKIMGILNLTPDSFSDGGKYQQSVDLALRHALQLVNEGADILDVGGESTRPGSKEVPWEEEIQRVIPLIQQLRHELPDIPISIDTRHSIVAQQAIQAGADIINDVSGGTFDLNMLSTVARYQVPIVLMHMRGTPQTMQHMTEYNDLVQDVSYELIQLSQSAQAQGIPTWLHILDPGIGFAKTIDQNLSLIQQFSQMKRYLGPSFPILFGPSRKGFIGKVTGESKPDDRDYGTVATGLIGTQQLHGNPVIVRVHNVRAMKHAYRMLEAIQNA